MKTTFILILIASASLLRAQDINSQVHTLVGEIEQGKIDEVRKQLPALTSSHGNDPAVLYLQARLSSNGVEAIRYYQSIVDNFPKSEWADDALYATYQYYYALGLYKTADLKLQQLKRDYPQSPHAAASAATPPAPAENKAVILPAAKDPAVAETAKTAEQAAQPPAEPYTLQVGAFSTVKNAEHQKDMLEKQGITAVITNKVRGGRSLYLVWAGSFLTADEAKNFGKKVKQQLKLDSIVVEKY
jgi:cell division septation protein DedD